MDLILVGYTLQVTQIDFSWLHFVSQIFFFENDIIKDCTKMPSSFCCDFDVATCEYSFSIMLLYNKKWLWWLWVVTIFWTFRVSHQILISSNFPAPITSSAKVTCLTLLLKDYRQSSNRAKPKAYAAIAVGYPCVIPSRNLNSFSPIIKSRTDIAKQL